MRRLIGLALAVALMLPALAVMGGEPYEYYKDKFDEVSFSGSNGSLQWKSPWVEFGDEYVGPAEGNVHVGSDGCSGKCLHLEGELLDIDAYGVYRSADLSMFETVELCFEMQIDGISEAVLSVYVTRDGSGWERVRSYPVLTQSGYHHPIVDLDDYRTEKFAVKLKVEGLLGGEVITIDNVELKGTLAGTTTSSSSSTSSTSSSTSTSSTTSTSTTSSTTSTTVARSTATTTPIATSTTDSSRATTASTTSSSTTTTAATTTTSSGTGAGVPPQPPFDSGLRDSPGGLIADYGTGMMGDMQMEQVEVLGAVITADFSLAHEAFEEVKVWMAVLALFIAAAIVSGMDWRRSRKTVE